MMPELQSLSARSSALASFSSRMAASFAVLVEQQPAIAGRHLRLEADHHEIGAVVKLGADLGQRLGRNSGVSP